MNRGRRACGGIRDDESYQKYGGVSNIPASIDRSQGLALVSLNTTIITINNHYALL